jgi:hypothetical protein
LAAEVNLANDGVGLDNFDRSFTKDAAHMEHGYRPGELADKVHIVLCDDDRMRTCQPVE